MWEGRGKERESNNGCGDRKSLLLNSTILSSYRCDRDVQREREWKELDENREEMARYAMIETILLLLNVDRRWWGT